MRVRVVPFPAAVSAPPPDGAKAPRSRPQSSVGAALRRPALSSADLRRGSNPVPMRMNPEIHADTRNERVWNPGHRAQRVFRTSPRAPCVSATSIDTGTQPAAGCASLCGTDELGVPGPFGPTRKTRLFPQIAQANARGLSPQTDASRSVL